MKHGSRLFLAALIAFAGCRAQDVHPVTKRPIAQVMGMGGADWLTRPDREKEEQPERALDAIGIQTGATVADVGAGVGYFTWRIAERVGPQGRVYAEDIQPGMLDRLKQNVAERGLRNVTAVLGTEQDPKLPADSMDLVMLVDVYHEFSEPRVMLERIRAALRPDGRLVLLEYRKEDPKVPIRPEHKMTVKMVKQEIEPEGYRLDQVIETLPQQHIIIFRKSIQ